MMCVYSVMLSDLLEGLEGPFVDDSCASLEL